MDAHAVMGSRMVPMSRFTGRLSFTIRYHRFDAQGRLIGLAQARLSPEPSGQLTKTREIIGTYATNTNLTRH